MQKRVSSAWRRTAGGVRRWAEAGRIETTTLPSGRQGVDGQDEARRHIPAVRAEMAALGIRLDRRVRVTLVEPDSINAGSPSLCLGRTVQRLWVGTSQVDVLGIEIARGLTATSMAPTRCAERRKLLSWRTL